MGDHSRFPSAELGMRLERLDLGEQKEGVDLLVAYLLPRLEQPWVSSRYLLQLWARTKQTVREGG